LAPGAGTPFEEAVIEQLHESARREIDTIEAEARAECRALTGTEYMRVALLRLVVAQTRGRPRQGAKESTDA
jgi:hypothetical protein